MKKKSGATSSATLLKRLASSVPNDAVKLLFLDNEDLSVLEDLDLFLLSEIKRSANGAVEMKFVDRLAVIRELNELKRDSEKSARDSFYTALERSAMMLRDGANDE